MLRPSAGVDFIGLIRVTTLPGADVFEHSVQTTTENDKPLSFFVVVCTGSRGILGVVQASVDTEVSEVPCTEMRSAQ